MFKKNKNSTFIFVQPLLFTLANLEPFLIAGSNSWNCLNPSLPLPLQHFLTQNQVEL
jgi:hypothetical protein